MDGDTKENRCRGIEVQGGQVVVLGRSRESPRVRVVLLRLDDGTPNRN